jgi:hypothetical protein
MTSASTAITQRQTSALTTTAPTVGEPSPTQAIPASTPTPTVSPELATEVGDAYQAYWQVRAQALYDLDTSHLPEVMSGDHLAAVQARIDELRSEGRAIDTEVDHNFVVIQAVGDDAEVADSYVDNSVYVDLQDKSQLTTPTKQMLNEVYVMNRTDGIWRVVDLVRST